MEPVQTPPDTAKKPRRFGTKSHWYILIALGLLFSYLGAPEPDLVDDLVPDRMVSFRKFTNENFAAYLDGLPNQSAKESSYQAHSLLDSQVGAIWAANLKASAGDSSIALSKTLPALIADGWSDAAARDILAWGNAKAYIIISRNPQEWCVGDDCSPRTEEQIRASIKDISGLSEQVLSAIYAELAFDAARIKKNR